MISETLEPFLDAGMAGLLWGFVICLWLFAHELIKDYTRFGSKYNPPELEEYAIVGLAIVMLSALTFIVLLWTLTIMGVM